MKKVIFYTLCSLFILNFSSLQAQTDGDELFDNAYLHEIRINFEQSNFWDSLSYYYNTFGPSIDGSGNIPYLMGQIQIDGNLVDSIGVRQKGFSSHFSSNALKKSLKVDINEFVSGKKYDGLKKFNLHNGVGDPGFQRDFLCYNMMRETSVNAPRVAYCKLYLNDSFWGVYTLTEQIDKGFLRRNFANGTGNLFKNTGNSDLKWIDNNPNSYSFELKTNKTENDWTKFIELLNVINNSTDANFKTDIQEVFAVEHYLRVLAIDIMTNNWDSYIEHGRNFYLYHEPDSDLFYWIPWDYNFAMGGSLSQDGDPDPPIDTLCPLQASFTSNINFDNFEVSFTNGSIPNDIDSFSWNFGDGNNSTEENPTHTYATAGTYNICLSITKMINGNNCEKTKCTQIDLGSNPADCQTIINGSSPYPASDPIFQAVIAQDQFCCNNDWDNTCQNLYDNIYGGGTTGGSGGDAFPLILNNPDKILIHRLMNVPQFRQQYLDICCEILDLNFTPERLVPLIDHNADLIREAVYVDPNYIFTTNYFEYDVGDGTGGGNGAAIPALRSFITNRLPQLDNQLESLNQECLAITSPIEWQDVVINEFMASNDSIGGIADPQGEYDDWIELYNNSSETVDLSDFYLSDDYTTQKKWAFPSGTTIAPNAYLIVWADQDLSQDGLHANFKLTKSGEQLIFTHKDNTVIDSLTYTEQQSNIASARRPNGTGNFVEQKATFLDSNENLVSIKPTAETLAFKVYPNPAKDFLQIELNAPANQLTIDIHNVLGQSIYQQQVSQASIKNYTIKLHNLQNGIYWLNIKSGSKTGVHKLIIQR